MNRAWRRDKVREPVDLPHSEYQTVTVIGYSLFVAGAPQATAIKRFVWPPGLEPPPPLVRRSFSEVVAVIGRCLFVAWSPQATLDMHAPAGTLQCPIGNSLLVMQLPSSPPPGATGVACKATCPVARSRRVQPELGSLSAAIVRIHKRIRLL